MNLITKCVVVLQLVYMYVYLWLVTVLSCGFACIHYTSEANCHLKEYGIVVLFICRLSSVTFAYKEDIDMTFSFLYSLNFSSAFIQYVS